MLSDLAAEFQRYRALGEKALAQMPDEALNRVTAPEGNSVAMIVRHIGGNLVSRFTDFLTSDGEKPWRDREREFDERPYSRAEMEEIWRRGWSVVETQLAALGDADLDREVSIRGQKMTVHAALCRSTTHIAYHVGQIVLLARAEATQPWQSLSIPRGKSDEFNRSMEQRK